MAVFRWIDDIPLVMTGAVAAGSALFGFLYRRMHRPGDTPQSVTMVDRSNQMGAMSVKRE
jgi:malic enzyme